MLGMKWAIQDYKDVKDEPTAKKNHLEKNHLPFEDLLGWAFELWHGISHKAVLSLFPEPNTVLGASTLEEIQGDEDFL